MKFLISKIWLFRGQLLYRIRKTFDDLDENAFRKHCGMKMPFENIVGKGENAGIQHFLVVSQSFLTILSHNLFYPVEV